MHASIKMSLCSTSLQIRASKGFVFATDARAARRLQVVELIFSPLFTNARKYSAAVFTELILFQMLAIGANFSFKLRELLYASGKSTETLFNVVLHSMRVYIVYFSTADPVWLDKVPSAEYLKQFVRGRLGSCAWGNALRSSQPTVGRKRSSQQALHFLLLGVWEPLR